MKLTIGEKLKKLRGKKSQKEVAKDVKITQSALGNYETDLRIPRDEVKMRIANYYGVSVEEIFFS